MRQILASSLIVILLSGCGKSDREALERETVSLDDLTVTVRDQPRSYFLSDRRGGFLLGSTGQATTSSNSWSVNGRDILRDIGRVTIDRKPLDPAAIDSIHVTPLQIVRFLHGGITETLLLLDQVPGARQAHALIVEVQTASPRDIFYSVQPGPELLRVPPSYTKEVLYGQEAGGTLAYSAGAQSEISPDGIGVRRTSKAVFALVYSPEEGANSLAASVHEAVDILRLSRRDRMERLLQKAYVRTSDKELTKALRWLQLSLDGFTVEAAETTGVAALPWDGSLNARDNAIALAGLDAATRNYETTSSMLRAIARHPDKSIDGGAWYAREAYEHVLASGDTGLVREIFPAVLAQIVGTQKQTDPYNLVTTRSGPFRGCRMADQQALWYFQQTIGSIFAAFLRDSTHAAQWAIMADLTSSAFNKMYIDTSRNLVRDHIAPGQRNSPNAGPGTLLCLDLIESEPVRRNTVKSVMENSLQPYGIVTFSSPGAAVKGDGRILNWMEGQMVYALTRYDCQHLSYPVTRRLAQRILTEDMVGVLPEMYEGNAKARPVGAPASLAAMAEYVRSFYQDYLGVRINMTTRSLAVEPKLPDEIRDVDFTILAGNHPVAARYERDEKSGRVMLRGEELTDSLRLTFLWTLKNGDAWRGATWLPPGPTITLLFGERDASALCDGKEMPLENIRHLVGFSQRSEIERP